MCGYGNALSFKDITDEDIDYVENFTKKKFHLGEIKQIKAMVLHVKKIVDENGVNNGLHRFRKTQKNDDSIRNEIDTHLTQLLAKTTLVEHETQTHYFLNKLLEAANRNSNREPGGYRYDSEIKAFASFLRMLVGPLAYQTLQKNLECALPSFPSVNRYIQSSKSWIIEGILRCDELKIYLEERGITEPFAVSLSEDATRTMGKVQYDSKTNQLVGFVLPTSGVNGMPIPFSYRARSAKEILDHFAGTNVISTFLNVIMAQPIARNVPAFCLLIFGSDNRYSSLDVLKRWKHIVAELKKLDIKVLAISSDSDPRYNSAMRQFSNLGIPSTEFPNWFSCGDKKDGPFLMQDTIHIATKLRNFLLRTYLDKKELPFGTHLIRVQHLYELLQKCSKDKHLLTPSTLNPTDKQNFDSVKKMCSPLVIKCLREQVANCDGTILYLQLLHDIVNSFMDQNLNALQRIRKLWYAVFLLRIWRRYIISHKKYTLKENFLTANCYSCIEMNAHSLVLCILHLEEIDKPQLFLPHLYESQPCEAIFRQFRSLSSVNSTVVNCTTKEAVSRISEIHLQNEIMQTTSTEFVYPRLKKTNIELDSFCSVLPSKAEIIKEIELCQRFAIITAHKFGLIGKTHETQNNFVCEINPFTPNDKRTLMVPSIQHIQILQLKNLRNIQLRDWTGKFNQCVPDETSLYTEIICSNNKKIVVKKSSLCWLLNPDQKRLSSDRLQRVRFSAERNQQSLRKVKQNKNISKQGIHSCLSRKRKRPTHFAKQIKSFYFKK